jgi:hypothetical protein
MYHRKQRGKVEKRVNCGVCLYPSTVQRLEKHRGEFSRSGFIESILLGYFEAMDSDRIDERQIGE